MENPFKILPGTYMLLSQNILFEATDLTTETGFPVYFSQPAHVQKPKSQHRKALLKLCNNNKQNNSPQSSSLANF